MTIFQRLESLAILIALLVAYHFLDFSWPWFAIFLFTPDMFMAGYLKDAKLGAIIYNIGHSYFSPIILLGVSLMESSSNHFGVMLSLIWAIHIAMDRALGFGLKLQTGFKDTHLGKL